MAAKKYVLVTGASKGIGEATALRLDRMGVHIFAGVRREADGEALRQKASERLTPILLDVTDGDTIRDAAEQVTRTVGAAGLAGLVNNAGIAVAAPLEFLPIEEFRRQMEVNVIGQIAVTQAFMPLLRQARGRVIVISSIGGRMSNPMTGAYHASKFALEALSDSLRLELQPWGMEVVVIQPGTIATPIWDTSTAAADQMMERMSPEVAAQMNHLYGAPLNAVRAWAASAAQTGISPDEVAKVVAEALTVQRPRTRYLVGIDARITAWIARLPDRLRDTLLLRRFASQPPTPQAQQDRQERHATS